ncbi:SETMR methyltransferase, partial [Pseudoatta argentina]
WKKNEFHAVIKHLHMKGLTPKEIKAELDNVHSTPAASRLGHLIEASAPKIIDKVHDIVLTDRRVKVREFVEATGISHGTVISILHEQLDMKMLTSSEKGEGRDVGRKGDGHSLLGIHIDYLPSKQTINGDYYAALLDRFNNILPHLTKKKVLFHQNNARVHTCMAKFNEFRYELLPHLAYSPDLAPCDYFVRRKEIHHQRAAHRRNRSLF